MISWGAIVITFGTLYWIGNGINGATGWFDYLKFSFAAAIARIYGLDHQSRKYRL